MTQIHAIALHTKLFTLVLDPTLILIFISFECGLNLNMRVKFKGGLNCQLPTAIRVKSKCGLTSRAGKMHVICMSNQVGVVFLPCGHLISCVNCSPKIKDCPFCRQFIKGKVKTYMYVIKQFN